MKDFYQHLNLNVLISAYFSDPEQRINLEKGDYLMREGDYNDRLFLVLKGSLSGYFNDPDGHSRFYFRLQSGMFAGVYSFFRRHFAAAQPSLRMNRRKWHLSIVPKNRCGWIKKRASANNLCR